MSRQKLIQSAFVVLLLSLFVLSGCNQKIKIEKLDDLPRHTYTIDQKAVDFLNDKTAVLALAEQVEEDLESDLATYDIEDKTTMKGYYGTLGVIAMLEGEHDEYLRLSAKRTLLEDKEALKLTNGMFTKAYISASDAPEAKRMDVFRKELASIVNDMPYDVVEAEIKQTKGRAEILAENLILGSIEASVQPILDKSNGEISKDIAESLLGSYYTIHYFIPHKKVIIDVLGAYLDEHKVARKPDIWDDRDFALTNGDGKKEIVVAVWDSGVDWEIFDDQMFVNENEVPGNGKDDDNNGYVDDVHGIAYTLHSDKTPELLYPLGDAATDRAMFQGHLKGLMDIQANIESKEASALKKMLSTMERPDVQPFLENLNKYGNYSHGTHVAGITARDNAYADILAARLTFDYRMIPETPTVEQAKKDAQAMTEAIDYFKKNNVRVVNMSWGNSLASVEAALEANNAGGEPEERKKLARKIFEITEVALSDAIAAASEIFFITSAGNANNDVNFEEFYPSSFDLPNIISVGAVDQAGDETDFTSFGKVDIYANGFEVDSYVPGGDRMKLSGTSMASPNVANLATKLLAVKPDLTVAQLRSAILDGCDERTAGDRTVKLMNPKKSLDLVKGM